MANFRLGLKLQTEGAPKAASEVLRLESAINQVKAANRKAEATARELRDVYKLSDKEIVQVTQALRDAEQAAGQLNREASGFDDLLQGIGQGIGQQLSGLVASGFGSAVEVVRDFVASTLEVGQAARSSEVAFTTVLGSSEKAQQTLKELSDFAAKTPFDLPGVRSAGQQLLAFGFQANELVDTLGRVGNVAAGVQTDFGELATIYGKARVQGRLFAEDINQLTERGIPIIQELAKQFGVTESEVKKLTESGQVGFQNLEQAFIDLTSEGGKFFNLMGTQSQTVVGQISNLGDSFVQLQEKVFKAFEPALAEGLKLFSDTLDEAGERSNALEILGDAGERLQKSLADNPELARQLGDALAFAADEAAKLVGDGLVGLGEFLEENPDKVQQFIEQGKVMISIIGQLVGVVGPLLEILLALGALFSAAFTPFLKIGDAVLEKVNAIADRLGFVIDHIDRLRGFIGGIDPQPIQGVTDSLGGIAGVADAVAQGYRNIADAAGAAAGSSNSLTQAITQQATVFDGASRALDLQEQQQKAALLSRGASQEELTKLEDDFLKRRIALNEQRLNQLKAIEEDATATPEQKAAANKDYLKLEEETTKLRVDLAKSAADQIEAQAKREQKAREDAAKAQAEAIKTAREEQSRLQEEAFSDQQDVDTQDFSDELDAFKDLKDAEVEVAQRAEDKQVDLLKRSFDERQDLRKRDFDQQAEQRLQNLDAEKDALDKAQKAASDAIKKRQAEEARANDAKLSALEREVDRRVQLDEAASGAERKRLEEQFAEEDRAAQRRRQIEQDVLNQQGAVVGRAQAQGLLNESPLEAASRQFSERQQAEQDAQTQAFAAQQEELANRRKATEEEIAVQRQQLEDQLEAEKLAFEDELEARKLAFEDEIAAKKRTTEEEIESRRRTFEDSQRQAEQAFKEQQRQLDIQAANRIKQILESARGSGSTQSLREGGIAEGGIVQVHKDEFLVPPKGTRVVSQRESRRLVRESLSARQVAPILKAASASSGLGLNQVLNGDLRGVESRLDALLTAIKKRPAPSFPANINLGQNATPYDAMQVAIAHQRAAIISRGLF
jgi:tape measure domain-containing protein